jgi:hypothetical protein
VKKNDNFGLEDVSDVKESIHTHIYLSRWNYSSPCPIKMSWNQKSSLKSTVLFGVLYRHKPRAVFRFVASVAVSYSLKWTKFALLLFFYLT